MTETEAVREQVATFRKRIDDLRAEIAKAIVGNREVVDGVLTCMLAGGARAARGRARASARRCSCARSPRRCRSTFSRIQFTPDLMPADILGTTVIDETQGGAKSFEFRKGPDLREHRARRRDEPRDAEDAERAARGDAGAPRHASASATHMLDEPFFVLATQNPLEMEGTYPLPEAQLDRFFFKLHVAVPEPRRAARDPRSHDGRAHAEASRRCSTATRSSRCSSSCGRSRSRGTCRTTRSACSRRRTPTAPTRPDLAQALRALRQLAARRAGGAPRREDPRALRRALRRERRRRARGRAPGAAPSRAPQLRGRGRGHQDRPGHRRDPQDHSRDDRREARRRELKAMTASGSSSSVLSSWWSRLRRKESDTPAADDDLFDDEFQRKLEYLALVSRRVFAGRLRAERRTKKTGSGVEFADHRDYAARRRLPLPRLERLPALRSAARAPLRGGGRPRDLLHPRHARRRWRSATAQKLRYAKQARAPRSRTSASRTSIASSIVTTSDASCERMPTTRGKARIFKVVPLPARASRPTGTTDLGDAMKTFVAQNKRRGLAVLVSDLYDPAGFERGHQRAPLQQVRSVRRPRRRPARGASPSSTATCSSTTARPATSARSRSPRRCSSASPPRYAEYLAEHRALLRDAAGAATSRADVDVPFDELILRVFRRGGFLRVIFAGLPLADARGDLRRRRRRRGGALHPEAPPARRSPCRSRRCGSASSATRRRRASSRSSSGSSRSCCSSRSSRSSSSRSAIRAPRRASSRGATSSSSSTRARRCRRPTSRRTASARRRTR